MKINVKTKDSKPIIAKALPEDIRRGLLDLVARVGENVAREATGLSRGAFARALAGLSVHRGTQVMVNAALGRAS